MNIKLNYHTARLYSQIELQNNVTEFMQIRRVIILQYSRQNM